MVTHHTRDIYASLEIRNVSSGHPTSRSVFVCHYSFPVSNLNRNYFGGSLAAQENAAQNAEEQKEPTDDDSGVKERFVESAAGALNGIGVSAESTADGCLPLLEQDNTDQQDGDNNSNQVERGIHELVCPS